MKPLSSPHGVLPLTLLRAGALQAVLELSSSPSLLDSSLVVGATFSQAISGWHTDFMALGNCSLRTIERSSNTTFRLTGAGGRGGRQFAGLFVRACMRCSTAQRTLAYPAGHGAS
jgi:hypothetical protein